MNKLICAICPTCNRPELLGRAVRAFEKQTYENRFLIIVDDLGQYKNQSGDRWQLVSFPQRILTLGEKNNVCASLAPRETWGYAKWDDDDLYMPWHLEAMAEALSRGRFVQPRYAIDFWNHKWVVTETYSRKKPNHYCYHGCWGYTRELYASVGGYRNRYAGDDGELQSRLLEMGIHSVGFDEGFKPSYWYNRPLSNRISELGNTEEVYWNIGHNSSYVGDVPKWTGDDIFQQEIPMEVVKRQW